MERTVTAVPNAPHIQTGSFIISTVFTLPWLALDMPHRTETKKILIKKYVGITLEHARQLKIVFLKKNDECNPDQFDFFWQPYSIRV